MIDILFRFIDQIIYSIIFLKKKILSNLSDLRIN